MSIQPKITKVSRQRRDHSLKNLHQRKRSNVIHISIRSLNSTHPIDKKSFNSKTNSSILSTGHKLKNSFINQSSIDKPTDTTSLSVRQNTWKNEDLDRYSTDKQTCMNNQQESNKKKDLNIQMNQTGSTQDHHREKKKKNKCRRACLFICLLVTLIIIAIAIILAVLLTRKSTTTTIPPNTATLRWYSSGITLVGEAGIYGISPNLLHSPYGLAFDSSNTLHIVDCLNNRVQKLITGTSNCVTVAGQANATIGNASNELSGPAGILFDSNDNMYISDRGNVRVQFWAKGATSGVTAAGIGGTLNISFSGPTTIVSDPISGTMFISDTYSNRIVSYPAGAVVAGGNGPGNNNTQLYFPFGLVYDSVSKSFIIPNFITNNIVRWTLGATSRVLVAGDATGSSGGTSILFNDPVGLTMDPMGNIYVADSNNHRIQLLLAGQSSATTIAGITGSSGTNSTQLNCPYWVILDNQLNLYVSDTCNHRVQKFLRY